MYYKMKSLKSDGEYLKYDMAPAEVVTQYIRTF